MANTSATGGYLTPTTAPITDGALEDVIHDAIAAITGLDPDLYVRPRWTPQGATLPDFGTDWCAFAVVATTPDTYAYEEHDTDSGGGTTQTVRHESLSVLVTFYGPNDEGYAGRLRDGLSISQNREILRTFGIDFISAGGFTSGPELVKNQWLPRTDMTVTLRREVRRTYAILDIQSAAGEIRTPNLKVSFST